MKLPSFAFLLASLLHLSLGILFHQKILPLYLAKQQERALALKNTQMWNKQWQELRQNSIVVEAEAPLPPLKHLNRRPLKTLQTPTPNPLIPTHQIAEDSGISVPAPRYPEMSRKLLEEGVVILAKSERYEFRILKSSGSSRLDEEALKHYQGISNSLKQSLPDKFEIEFKLK